MAQGGRASRVTPAANTLNSAVGRRFIATANWGVSACKYKVVWFCLFSKEPWDLIFTSAEIPLSVTSRGTLARAVLSPQCG